MSSLKRPADSCLSQAQIVIINRSQRKLCIIGFIENQSIVIDELRAFVSRIVDLFLRGATNAYGQHKGG